MKWETFTFIAVTHVKAFYLMQAIIALVFLMPDFLCTWGACCNVKELVPPAHARWKLQSHAMLLWEFHAAVMLWIMEAKGSGSYRGHMWAHAQSLALSGNPLVSSELVFWGPPEWPTMLCIVWLVRRCCPKGTSEYAVVRHTRCSH